MLEYSRPDFSRGGAGTIAMHIPPYALLLIAMIIAFGNPSRAMEAPTWTKGYRDCGEEPLALFLEIGPFSHGDVIDIRNILSEEKLSPLHRQFLKRYPQCRITPILEFLIAMQMKYLDDNNMRSGANPFKTDIASAFRHIADQHPEASLPFDISSGDNFFHSGSLIAPAALMSIADLRSRRFLGTAPSVANGWLDEAAQAWSEVLNRFPKAKAGPENMFSTEALAHLITYYACLAGSPSTCKVQSDNAKKFSTIALRQYPNLAYSDGHYCGTLHPHALFALASAEADGEKACGHLKEILHKHAEEGFFACETDAGGIIGYDALHMMDDRCKEARSCILCFREVVNDRNISHDWKGRAQYKLAVFYQAVLQDYRQAIREYRILAERFGDVVENDEDEGPTTPFRTIALERINSLDDYQKPIQRKIERCLSKEFGEIE